MERAQSACDANSRSKSANAIRKLYAACRGGIPVCWPQFNDMGEGQSHGFARNTAFKVTETYGSSVTLELTQEMISKDARSKFPHDFVLKVTVADSDDYGGSLTQVVRTRRGQIDLLRMHPSRTRQHAMCHQATMHESAGACFW